MKRILGLLFVLFALALVAAPLTRADDKPGSQMVVDKEKKTITITCAMAPRKLAKYTEVYPLEIVACYPDDYEIQGKKAHETVVTFTKIKPSEVHKALESFGLKPGKPGMGVGQTGSGPEVKIYLEVPGADGQPQKVPIEKTMQDRKTAKPMPALKWYFTGSAMQQPNPEKDEKVYGADVTGTLIAIFPVTNETVIQAHLKFEDQELLRLETNKNVVPKEGAPVKLIIEAK
jgi:hypothetical protein